MPKLTLSDGRQLDPQELDPNPIDTGAYKLMGVIKGLEGGDYNDRSGDGGSSAGALQWNNNKVPLKPGEMPSNWKNAAAQYLKDANAPMTPENQNYVGYQQIKAYKNQGRTPEEIDALWNGARKDKATGKYVHNADERAKKFRAAILGGSNQGGGVSSKMTQSSARKNEAGYYTKTDIPETVSSGAVEQPKGLLGTNKNDSMYGKLIDNSITRGLINAVPGAKTLGTSLGAGAGLAYTGAKDIVKGTNESKFYDTKAPSPLDTTLAGGNVVLSALSAKGLGGLVQGALQKGNVLYSPVVKEAMKGFRIPMAEFKLMSNAEKFNALSEASKNASPAAKVVLNKALGQLEPLLTQRSPLISKALSLAKGVGGGITKAAIGLGVGATLGNPLGRVIDRFTR